MCRDAQDGPEAPTWAPWETSAVLDIAEALNAARHALVEGRRADVPRLAAMLSRDAAHAPAGQAAEAVALVIVLDAAIRGGVAPV